MSYWLDLLGGAGEGVAAGVQDVNEMKKQKLEAESLKQQMSMRDLQMEQMRQDAAKRSELRGIKTVGTQVPTDGVSSQDAAESGGQLQAANNYKTYTSGDQQRDISSVLARYGDTEGAYKATERGRGQDIQDAKDAITKHYREKILGPLEQDPVGFLSQYAPGYYNQNIPDGNKAVVASTPGGLQVNVMDQKTGKPVSQHNIPMTQVRSAAHEVAQRMYLHDIGAVSPEDFRTGFTDEMNLDKAKSRIQLEGKQGTLAEQHGAYFGAEGASLPARMKALQTTADAHMMLARAAQSRAEQEKDGQPTQLGTDADGKPVWGYLSKNGKTGGAKFNLIDVPDNVRTGKAPRKLERMANQDGTITVFDENQQPQYNIIDGTQVPANVGANAWGKIQKDAASSGVQVIPGRDDKGNVVLGYRGKDGQVYDSVQEAKKAKKPAKNGLQKAGDAAATPVGPPNPDAVLQNATPAQLWGAIDDPATKPFAVQELRRRGLLQEENSPGGGGKAYLSPV